ncbi:lipopolysaccharide biosynthesis protein [Desulforegula conservatrix]|uniref:lipopolysaccharide biosynthesis protein n=1 Tax=Desulforegula conservatrix TaxID=153026 RepID=UPI0004140954|nr:oligosaccharide flippase family protein [Desulforegula conservatrix]
MILRLRQLAKKQHGILYALIDQAIVSGCNFLTGIIIARFLGVNEYGKFTLAWMTVLFFNSIQLAVIISPMMSLAPSKKEPKEKEAFYNNFFSLQLLLTIFSVIFLFSAIKISIYFKPEMNLQALCFPLCCSLAAYQVQDFYRRFFFSKNSHKEALLNDCVSYLGQLIMLIILFKFISLNTLDVLYVVSGTSLVAVILGYFRSKGLRINLNHTNIKKSIIDNWRMTKWLLFSAFLQWTTGNFFIVTVASINGASAAGAIRATQNLIAITHVFFQAFENIFPSKMTKIFLSKGLDGLKSYVLKVSFWGCVLVSFIVAGIALFPSFWLTLFYGKKYIAYANILTWWGPIYILMYLNFPLRAAFRTIDYTKAIFISYGLMSVFTLLSANKLTVLFGASGAMIGILLTQIISCIILFFLFFKSKKTIKS